MSFVMIATGPASSGAPVRTLSIRSLLFGGGVVAFLLLAAGVGLGWWISIVAAPHADEPRRAASPAMPFTLEQLGALSGRLFKLESQASQLSERLGTPAKTPAAAAGKKPGTGGPMLPPRATDDIPDALDDLGALEARFASIEQQMALVADASATRNLELMRLPTRLPIEDAELTSTFGNREDPITGRRAFHAGIDFAAEPGTEIHAAAGGTVSFAGFRSDFGWMVEIDHGNGFSTRYAHASKLLVKPNALVTPGEVVAMSGSTGRSTGPHLHFEVLQHGEPADPRRFLAGL
jgi:murein DD-endopeptidase MepM/ murein hydrolase activator NlpD